MSVQMQIAFGVLVVSVTGILTVFALYPIAAFLVSRAIPRPWKRSDTHLPTVTLVIAVRNAADIIEEKLRNIVELNYPEDKLDAVFFVDGSDDNTADLIRQYGCDRMHVYEDSEHRGKISALNRAVPHAGGDILVFSDTDAILSANSVKALVRHFADERIGGVCGQRVIHRDQSDLRVAQDRYIRFDSALKGFESAVWSVASNDGKLFSMRRELFRPVMEAVTDDFYLCLTVVEQGFRFVFDPEARAHVRIPSRNPRHEIQRRRRIVSPSLRAMVAKRRLANPFRYGLFAFALVCNRFVRRMLPLLRYRESFSRCASPPDNVFIGCPNRKYPNPTLVSGVSRAGHGMLRNAHVLSCPGRVLLWRAFLPGGTPSDSNAPRPGQTPLHGVLLCDWQCRHVSRHS